MRTLFRRLPMLNTRLATRSATRLATGRYDRPDGHPMDDLGRQIPK